MNDTQQVKSDTRSYAPVIGFALGALVGGVLGIMLAPASGEKTRRRIGDAARRLNADARHTLDEARETVTEAATGLGGDVKAALHAGREAFRHENESREPRPASRVAQMLDPTPPRTP